MGKFPRVSSTELIKFLATLGYQYDHEKGDHIILKKDGSRRLSVPKRKEMVCNSKSRCNICKKIDHVRIVFAMRYKNRPHVDYPNFEFIFFIKLANFAHTTSEIS